MNEINQFWSAFENYLLWTVNDKNYLNKLLKEAIFDKLAKELEDKGFVITTQLLKGTLEI